MEISGDKHNSVFLGEEQKHESFGVIQISRSSNSLLDTLKVK